MRLGRTALALALIGLVPVLVIPAFVVGLGVGLLALLGFLALASLLVLRPRQPTSQPGRGK